MVHLTMLGFPACGVRGVRVVGQEFSADGLATPEGDQLVAWIEIAQVTCPQCRARYEAANQRLKAKLDGVVGEVVRWAAGT